MERKELEPESIGTWDGDIAEYTDFHQYYLKEEADSVMDAMEDRIHELESNEQILNDVNCKLMDKLEEKDKRIKELEEQLKVDEDYFDLLVMNKVANERIKELEERIKTNIN